MVAFIPGQAQSGAFIQMISPEGARQFTVSQFTVQSGVIQADECRFSRRGCHIQLPDIRGEIHYSPFTPLGSHIMGPFRYFPMECRHGVLSMAHHLQGSITMDGHRYSFDGGLGYAETDRGTSFPRSYLWMQCNDFSEPCSLMISIARIPFSLLRRCLSRLYLCHPVPGERISSGNVSGRPPALLYAGTHLSYPRQPYARTEHYPCPYRPSSAFAGARENVRYHPGMLQRTSESKAESRRRNGV